MMESNDNAAKVKPMSASKQLADEGIEKKLLSYERLITCGSKPKIQLLELSENIRVAESSFDSIKQQWDKMKFRGGYYIQNESKFSQSQNSTSSYSSLKNMPSEHSIQHKEDRIDAEEEEAEEKENDNDNDRFMNEMKNPLDHDDNDDEDDVIEDKQLEVVLTPRTPNNNDVQNYDSVIVPKLDIRHDDSLESVKTNRRGRKTHKLKKNKSVSSKMNDEVLKTSLIYAAARGKKRKVNLRLKNTNSKSTIGTRDTIYSDKKQERKKFRRQKSVDAISLFQGPKKRVNLSKSKQLNTKHCIDSNYHSKPLKKGSLAVISNKQSKFEAPPILRLDDDTAHILGDDKIKRDFSVIGHGIEKVLRVDDQHCNYYEKKESKEAPKTETEECQTPKEEVNQTTANETSADYYDPLQQRNYELPTESSKLKRVHRPYYHNFNISSIPFVVGTSLSPSHNIGLNIQQVLSTIKIKQPTVPGISPVLIQNISKGIRPVSILFQHMNDQSARSCRSFSGHDASSAFQRANSELNRNGNSFSCDHFRSNNNHPLSSMTQQTPCRQNFTCEPLYEEDEDAQSQYSESRAKNHQILQARSSAFEYNKPPTRNSHAKQMRKQQQSSEIGVGYPMTGNSADYTSNSKEMAEVFTRLYEQFDKMIKQHEKLKEQIDKTKDKSLAKEALELEEAITAKEQEITAVVNLYREVKALKKQMKRMYERNSFVCIATEDPAFHHTAKIRASTADPFDRSLRQKYHYSGRVNTVHQAPNALRLTGLLRQIQAFQRQLALA